VAAMTGAMACSNTGSATGSVPAGRHVGAASGGVQIKVVTYCNRQQAKITEPATHGRRHPAVIYVHGGSWVSGNYDTGGFLINKIGPALAASEFVVMSVDYRLGPASKWPDQIEDVKCAVRYLRANAGALNVDPGEIGAWGQSAGGHLVNLLGTAGPTAGWDHGPYADESSRVEAVVDMAGPSDLLTMTDQGDSGNVQASFISLLDGPPNDLAAALRAASPVTYVKPGDPPFLIFHSDDDEIVYPQQSQELAWDLSVNHDPVQLVVVHGGGHNFDQAGETPGIDQITAMIVTFFVRHLHPHS
jgi:acetyl esterase/lipase